MIETREKQIEKDLQFAKKTYGTTGIHRYTIPIKDLPNQFQSSGATVIVNLSDIVRYKHTDNDFMFFYSTTRIEFSSNLSDILSIPDGIAVEVTSLLSSE